MWDRIRQLDRMRADFIANTSHELRSPLTVMRGYVDVLQDHWGELDDSRRREMLGKAGLGLVRLERLVADLLLVSRLEAGMLSLRADPVDIRGIVQEVAAEIATAYPGQVLTIEAALAPSVIGDRERLRQILTNLVDNAVKFSPIGAPLHRGSAHTTAGWQWPQSIMGRTSPPRQGSISFSVLARQAPCCAREQRSPA